MRLGVPTAMAERHLFKFGARPIPAVRILDLAILGLSVILFSVPFIRLGGWFYLIVLSVSAPFVLCKKALVPAGILVGLHGYQLLVTIFASRSVESSLELNAGLLPQTAAGVLAIAVINRWGPRIALFILGIIVFTAAVSLGLEISGADVQGVLPSTYHDTSSYGVDFATYGTDTRWRGVYPESSVLGAVVAGGCFVFACGLMASWGALGILKRIWLSAAIFAGLTCLAVTLTKAGIFMLIAGVGGALANVAVHPTVKKLLCVAVAVIGITTAGVMSFGFLPESLTDYVISEGSYVVQSIGGSAESRNFAGKGAFARQQGYLLSLYSLLSFPLGTSQAGIETVVQDHEIPLTEELSFDFNEGLYGLKNSLSNLAVTGGFAGLALLWMFIRKTITFCRLSSPKIRPHHWLMWSTVLMAVAFLLSVEGRYYVYAYCALIIAAACEMSHSGKNAPLSYRWPGRVPHFFTSSAGATPSLAVSTMEISPSGHSGSGAQPETSSPA